MNEKEFHALVAALPMNEQTKQELMANTQPVFAFHEYVKELYELNDEGAKIMEEAYSQSVMARVSKTLDHLTDPQDFQDAFIKATCVEMTIWADQIGFEDADNFGECMETLLVLSVEAEQRKQMNLN